MCAHTRASHSSIWNTKHTRKRQVIFPAYRSLTTSLYYYSQLVPQVPKHKKQPLAAKSCELQQAAKAIT